MRDHGTRQRYRLSSPPVNARANQEPTRYAEDAQAITQTFNKFWSRSSEAVSARQRCSQCHHDTLRSRRSEGGLARYTSAVSPIFLQICKICERGHPLPRKPFGGRGECFRG